MVEVLIKQGLKAEDIFVDPQEQTGEWEHYSLNHYRK
jgi:hypothetical protein